MTAFYAAALAWFWTTTPAQLYAVHVQGGAATAPAAAPPPPPSEGASQGSTTKKGQSPRSSGGANYAAPNKGDTIYNGI